MSLEKIINNIEDIFTMTVYIITSLNSFVIFLGRRFDPDEKYNLYFARFTFFCFLFTFVNSFIYNETFRPLAQIFNNLHPPLEMLFTFGVLYDFVRFASSFFKMSRSYEKVFFSSLSAFFLAFILTSASLISGDVWYFKNVYSFTLFAAGIGIGLLTINIGVFFIRSRIYSKGLPGRVAIIILFIVLYSFLEKIIVMVLNVELLVGSSFIFGFMVMLLSNFLSMNFNNEYKELMDLKNNLEKKVEQRTAELADANVRLQKLDLVKNDFIANITHDFRSPLTIILNTAHLALRSGRNVDQATSELFNTIHKASLKLKGNVDKLLELAKMDARGVELKITKVEPVSYLHELLDYYLSAVKPSGLQIVKELPDQVIDNFYTDIGKLEDVLDNVLANAVKFTDSKNGIITVGLAEARDHIDISIADNGIGIPQEKLSLIFNRFEQVHAGRNSLYHGSGIGLAFAKQLVGYLKGEIWAESEGEGQGATFIIRLKKGRSHFLEHEMQFIDSELLKTRNDTLSKLEADLQEKQQEKNCQTIFTDLNKESEFDYKKGIILVIDDDKDVREIVVKYLLNYGFKNFIITSDGRQGLVAVYKYPPDIIISDLNMPYLRGDEFHDQLLLDPQFRQIPFIFLSAITDEKLMLKRREKGAEAYLKKPIEEKLFIITVEENLKKYFEYKKAMQLATIDEVTGLNNRRALLQHLKHELLVRQYRELSLIFLDIDHFKEINDTHGHDTGDRVLALISDVIKFSIRNYDVAGRYGGDEFLIILVDTNLEQAMHVAEGLRAKINRTKMMQQGAALPLSASFGVVSLKASAGYIEKMLKLDSLEKIYRIDNSQSTDWEQIEKYKLQIAELLLKMADTTLYTAKYTVCNKCGFNSEKSHIFVDNKCPQCQNINLVLGRNKVMAFE